MNSTNNDQRLIGRPSGPLDGLTTVSVVLNGEPGGQAPHKGETDRIPAGRVTILPTPTRGRDQTAELSDNATDARRLSQSRRVPSSSAGGDGRRGSLKSGPLPGHWQDAVRAQFSQFGVSVHF